MNTALPMAFLTPRLCRRCFPPQPCSDCERELSLGKGSKYKDVVGKFPSPAFPSDGSKWISPTIPIFTCWGDLGWNDQICHHHVLIGYLSYLRQPTYFDFFFLTISCTRIWRLFFFLRIEIQNTKGLSSTFLPPENRFRSRWQEMKKDFVMQGKFDFVRLFPPSLPPRSSGLHTRTPSGRRGYSKWQWLDCGHPLNFMAKWRFELKSVCFYTSTAHHTRVVAMSHTIGHIVILLKQQL